MAQSIQRRRLARLLFAGATTLIALLAAEVVARFFVPRFDLSGARAKAATMRVEPGGKLTLPHEILGYRNAPGSFVMSFDGRRWDVTHSEDGTRPTREGWRAPDERPAIWIFGCSLTHGFGVNDEDTYCWKLQSQLADWQVVNFGVDGYSNLQCYLAFKEALKSRPAPRWVMLAYAGFHDIRNVVSREWRLHLSLANSSYGVTTLPHGRIDSTGLLALGNKTLAFVPVPFTSYSSLLTICEFASWKLDAHRNRAEDVTRQIIRDFDEEARRAGSRFLVAIVRSGGAMREFCQREGIACFDVSPDRNGRQDLFWDDGHPKPEGHDLMARDLLLALTGWRLDCTVQGEAIAEIDQPLHRGASPTWRVETLRTSGEPWSVQWIKSIPISKSDRIGLRFQARSSRERKIDLKPLLAGANESAGATTIIPLTPEWKEFEASFITNAEGWADIAWQLGVETGDFWIRGFEVNKNGRPLPESIPPSTGNEARTAAMPMEP